jgi:WD40 repeat protein
MLLEPGTLAPKAELERWRVHEAAQGPSSLAFSADGTLLAHIRPRASVGRTSRNAAATGAGGRGDWEGGLTLWDLSTSPPSRRYANDKIKAFAFLGDGRLASAMGQAADLSTIDTRSGQALRTVLLSYVGRRVTDPAVSAANSLRAVGISDGRVRLDRISEGGGSPPTEFQAHGGEVVQLAFTADGGFLVTAGADGLVKVWRPAGE